MAYVEEDGILANPWPMFSWNEPQIFWFSSQPVYRQYFKNDVIMTLLSVINISANCQHTFLAQWFNFLNKFLQMGNVLSVRLSICPCVCLLSRFLPLRATRRLKSTAILDKKWRRKNTAFKSYDVKTKSTSQ